MKNKNFVFGILGHIHLHGTGYRSVEKDLNIFCGVLENIEALNAQNITGGVKMIILCFILCLHINWKRFGHPQRCSREPLTGYGREALLRFEIGKNIKIPEITLIRLYDSPCLHIGSAQLEYSLQCFGESKRLMLRTSLGVSK